MSSDKEKMYYIRISIYNSNKNKPIFNWSSKGNIVFALAVANEEANRKVPFPENAPTKKSPNNRESHYSCAILLRNDATNSTIFEWDEYRPGVRAALECANEFVHKKLGLSDLTTSIRESMKKEETVKSAGQERPKGSELKPQSGTVELSKGYQTSKNFIISKDKNYLWQN
jgi:hypothetical protein